MGEVDRGKRRCAWDLSPASKLPTRPKSTQGSAKEASAEETVINVSFIYLVMLCFKYFMKFVNRPMS